MAAPTPPALHSCLAQEIVVFWHCEHADRWSLDLSKSTQPSGARSNLPSLFKVPGFNSKSWETGESLIQSFLPFWGLQVCCGSHLGLYPIWSASEIRFECDQRSAFGLGNLFFRGRFVHIPWCMSLFRVSFLLFHQSELCWLRGISAWYFQYYRNLYLNPSGIFL